jgi:UDP-N-acetylmuramate--alanine ligase
VLGKTRRVHFIGIGGIGMSGIAELLANLGYAVSGSDEKRSAATDRLSGMGIRLAIGHDAGNVGDADVVVLSSAVRPTNPEVREAGRRQIPVIPRAEMLAELMRLKTAIAVAGAHGKTTTTSMIALVLERAGLDPTAVIGGRLSAFGSNARLGHGELIVAEADESDRSFLKLFPTIAVITNIDHEHLENYGGFDDLQQAFVDFANKVPFYGSVVVCADDPNLAAILPRMTRRVRTYGLDAEGVDVSAFDVELGPGGAGATVRGHGRLELRVPGRHNLQNALAAVAVGLEIEVGFGHIAEALAGFRGVSRRFELRGEAAGVRVFDDYGHHPTEIAATLAAARGMGGRVLVVFQPHRYSRTEALREEFGRCFADADRVWVMDVYAAGEPQIAGISGRTVVDSAHAQGAPHVAYAPTAADAIEAVIHEARSGDVLLTLGAGDVSKLGDALLAGLQRAGAATGDRR